MKLTKNDLRIGQWIALQYGTDRYEDLVEVLAVNDEHDQVYLADEFSDGDWLSLPIYGAIQN